MPAFRRAWVLGDAMAGKARPRTIALSAILVCVLNFTPPDRLTDAKGRPYFLWDCDLTLDQFRRALEGPDPDVRAYLVGKLMRQARPDDVFQFVRPGDIRQMWPRLSRYLGRSREFWTWLLDTWEGQGHDWR